MSVFPKCVMIDLGDTTIRHSDASIWNSLEKIFTYSGILLTPDDFRAAARGEWRKRDGVSERKKIASVHTDDQEVSFYTDFYTSMLDNLGIDSPHAKLIEELVLNFQISPAAYEFFPNIQEVLSTLKNAGMKLIIMSNAFPSARKIVDYFQLAQYFDEIFLSCDSRQQLGINTLKPETTYFDRVMQKMQVAPNECAFLDDRETFLEGATLAEIGTTIWFNPEGNPPKAWSGLEIANWEELPQVFGIDYSLFFRTEAINMMAVR